MSSAWARIKEAMGKRSNMQMAFYLLHILLFLFLFFGGRGPTGEVFFMEHRQLRVCCVQFERLLLHLVFRLLLCKYYYSE